MAPYMSVPMAPQYPPAGAGHKLFVGMIPYSTGEAELHGVFSHFGPLMEVSGNTIYNKAGSWSAKVCDKTNVLAGKWPDAAAVVEMGRKVLGFPGAAAAPVEASA